MILQALHVPQWSGLVSQTYWSFWGHVARIPDAGRAIRVVLSCSWQLDLNATRRLGNWPDHHRLIQLAWQLVREPTAAGLWQSAAQNRRLWAASCHSWMQLSRLRNVHAYQSLEDVDLNGRCLLRAGDRFALLSTQKAPSCGAMLCI